MTKHVVVMLVAAATAGWTVGCGPAECARDTDCKGARVCRSGGCVDPSSAGGAGGSGAGGAGGSGAGGAGGASACSSGRDSDCPAGFWCNQEQCVATTKKKVGELCRGVDECAGGSCLVRMQGDLSGYCSKQCDSFSECPSFWSCEQIANGAGKRCVQK